MCLFILLYGERLSNLTLNDSSLSLEYWDKKGHRTEKKKVLCLRNWINLFNKLRGIHQYFGALPIL